MKYELGRRLLFDYFISVYYCKFRVVNNFNSSMLLAVMMHGKSEKRSKNSRRNRAAVRIKRPVILKWNDILLKKVSGKMT